MSTLKRLLFLLCFVSPFAFSTNLVFDTSGNIVGHYVGRASVAADWFYSGGRAGAVASSAGTALAEGLSVPTAFTASFSAEAVAGLGARVVTGANVIGAAFLAYQTYNAIKDSGLSVCSASQGFFCTSPKIQPLTWCTSQGCGPDANTVETSYCKSASGASDATPMPLRKTDTAGTKTYYDFDCQYTSPYDPGAGKTAIYPGLHITSDVNGPPTVGQERLATDSEIRQSIVDKQNADHEYGRRVMEAMRADSLRNPSLVPPGSLAPSDTPISVAAAPVTGPSLNTSTETITNPDGSTSTVRKDSTTTVTPVTSGNTIATSNTVYNTSTAVVTTTTNNTTGAVTTVNSTTNALGNQSGTPGATDTGPKECGTPGKPKCQIEEAGTPTVDQYKQAVDDGFKSNDDKNAEKTAVIDGITPASVGVFDWFPRIQSAECADPEIPEILTKTMHTVPICGAVRTLSKFLSGVMAFFALLGSVRNVQSALKA